jgi:Uma2 family endonuclease
MVAIPALYEKFISEADYLALGDGYEIMDGIIRECSLMGTYGSIVRDNLYDVLRPVVKTQKLGYLHGDGVIYYMWKEDKGIKGAFIPDLSFIRKANLIADWQPTDNYPGVPDFAVEVFSPGNEAVAMLLKIRRYLERGTEEVWLIYPEAQEVHQYRIDMPDTVRVYRGAASINVEAFFPGVKIAIQDLFALPDLGE